MSDFPPPPPLPPLAEPAPQPAPGLAPFGGVPMASVAYPPAAVATPRVTRPGVLTALGVMSILGGCASFLACIAALLLSLALYGAAKQVDLAVASRSTPTTLPAYLFPATPTNAPVEVGPGGLPDAQRRLAVAVVESIHPLGRPRVEQLDAILARAGRKMLAVQDVPRLDADAVRAAVVDHGQLYGGGRKSDPPDFIKTPAGRLELYDERAVFHFDDGSPPLRSTTAAASAPKPLTAEQVQAVVKQVRSASEGARLTESQVSGVAAVLALPNQRLAQASAGLATEPRAVTIHPSGGATVRFNGGDLFLGARGQILNQAPSASDEPGSAAKGAALATVVASDAIGVGLAVFLLVAGVLLLRDAPGRCAGRRLHVIWAVIKIPVALVAAAGAWWMLATFLNAASALPPGPLYSRGTGALAWSMRWAKDAFWLPVVVAVLGCVYPVAVLLAFRGKRVREFYKPQQ